MAIFSIPNLYQSFWEKLSKKIETDIFGHSKFIPVFLGNIVRKRLEQTFLAIPNLYQSFWEKLLEKIWNNHFWPFQIYTSLFGKNCWKKYRMAIFGHSKFVPVFLRKIVGKKFKMAIFGHTKFIAVLLGNIVKKNWNIHFWPFLIYTSLFGKNCWKKNLEWPFLAIPNLYQSFWETLSKKNWNIHFWPFLIYTSPFGKNCQKKIGTSIFHHS